MLRFLWREMREVFKVICMEGSASHHREMIGMIHHCKNGRNGEALGFMDQWIITSITTTIEKLSCGIPEHHLIPCSFSQA